MEGNHIGHHSIIEDHCFISSHTVISGYCNIKKNTFIGVNATISNNTSISAYNWIGPGSLILKDTEHNSLYKEAGTAKSRVKPLNFFKAND